MGIHWRWTGHSLAALSAAQLRRLYGWKFAQGAQNNRELLELTRFLRQFYIEHPTIADNNWTMRQFGRFNLSHKIDMADVMIASVAVRLAVPLYTLNIRHYEPLPDVDEQRPY